MNDSVTMYIDLGQLKKNIETIKEYSQKDIIVVVKSNAYRMGDVEVVSYLEKQGVHYFAVVDTDEARRLCEHGITANILILNPITVEDYPLLEQYPNLLITLNTIEECKLLATHYDQPIRVHIQIDTGMSRLGFTSQEDVVEGLWYLKRKSNILIEGIYTHLTMPESLEKQEEKFKKYIPLHSFPMVHLAASNSYRRAKTGNFVRVGLDCYGDGAEDGCEQILTVVARPISVHTVKKGATIGYNETYTVLEDCRVALLPIGYQNGYRRSMRHFWVLCNGKKYQTIGNICMNHTYVLVDETIDCMSEFTLTSKEIPIVELAEKMQTNTHEVLCSFEIPNRRYIVDVTNGTL